MAIFGKVSTSGTSHIKQELPTAEPGREFIFRLRNGLEVGRARGLSDFAYKVKTVPVESLEYHVSGKHFSPWLRYLKMDSLADSIERLNSKGERLRQDILNEINKALLK